MAGLVEWLLIHLLLRVPARDDTNFQTWNLKDSSQYLTQISAAHLAKKRNNRQAIAFLLLIYDHFTNGVSRLCTQ